MNTVEKTIIVTEQEWQERRKAAWQRELESWTRSRAIDPDYDGDPALEDFFWSGDVERFAYAKTQEEGQRLGGYWWWVLLSEPSRNYEALINNIKIFWNWVLNDPDGRLPYNSRMQTRTAQECFEEPITHLGGVNSPILDPACSARFFKECYGETFQAETVFPYPLGKEGWQPVLRSEPEDRFLKLSSSLNGYLFFQERGIHYRQCLEVLDHLFSTIPLLPDRRIFHTYLYEDEEVCEKGLVGKQYAIRGFLANLYDYNVYHEDGLEGVPHNDPELEALIKEKFNALMPDEYHGLIDFIHRHKEECIFESE